MVRTINLNEFNKVQGFVQDIGRVDSEMDIIRGRYIIDAKSIMGIYSLDLSKPVDIKLHSTDINVISLFNEICDRYQ